MSTPCVCQCLTTCRSSSERQQQLLCTVYGVIQQGDVPMSSMLQAMMERVLLPLASHCSTKALNDFFVANVSDIIILVLSRFTKVCLLTLSHLGEYLKMNNKYFNSCKCDFIVCFNGNVFSAFNQTLGS